MRTPIIAGNWKMNKTASEGAALVREIAEAAAQSPAEVVVCPPSLCIPAAVEAASGTPNRPRRSEWPMMTCVTPRSASISGELWPV